MNTCVPGRSVERYLLLLVINYIYIWKNILPNIFYAVAFLYAYPMNTKGEAGNSKIKSIIIGIK